MAHGGGQVQRATTRRSSDRALPARPGRATRTRQGQLPGALRRDGTPVREQRSQHQEQVVLRHGRPGGAGRGRPGRDHRPGWPLRWLEPVMPRTATPSSSTTCWASSQFGIEATEPIPTGKTQVRMEFAYDGGGFGKGGTVTLYCDGKEVGEGRVEQTQGFIFSADETTDIGYESGTTVSSRLHRPHQPVSTARSTGSRSTLARTPRTPTTSSRQKSASAWRWRASSATGSEPTEPG